MKGETKGDYACIYICNSAIKRNKIVIYAKTGINFENIMPEKNNPDTERHILYDSIKSSF